MRGAARPGASQIPSCDGPSHRHRPISAAGLIAGFAVAVGTGSRPLGGAVLAAFGLSCIAVWLARDGVRITAQLTGIGLLAFALRMCSGS